VRDVTRVECRVQCRKYKLAAAPNGCHYESSVNEDGCPVHYLVCENGMAH
jgi:hypothetical protein